MRSCRAAVLGILICCGCGPVWAQASAAASASAVPAEDIRDIRAPKSRLTLTDSLVWPIVAAVAVMLAAGGWDLWRWRRRRVRGPTLLPFEIALRQLEQAGRVMQPAAGREFAAVVSDIVRRYIELQFNVTVTQRTTQEFLQDLLSSSSTPLAQQQSRLAEFLQQSDLIKFAGDSSSLPTLESLLQSARQLVRETARTATAHVPVPAT